MDKLEEVFASLDEKVRSKHCDGIAGIIEEGKSVMEEDFDDDTMDACLIASGQREDTEEEDDGDRPRRLRPRVQRSPRRQRGSRPDPRRQGPAR